MEKIDSFTINHETMLRGIYLSRQDKVGNEIITSFDIRMKEPNREPVLGLGEIHSMEHLGATFLRNQPEWKDKVIYFGPMGCCTGFYLLLGGDLSPEEVVPLVTELYDFIADFEGEIPGATARDCGCYHINNLPMAKYEAGKFVKEVLQNIQPENMIYPKD